MHCKPSLKVIKNTPICCVFGLQSSTDTARLLGSMSLTFLSEKCVPIRRIKINPFHTIPPAKQSLIAFDQHILITVRC